MAQSESLCKYNPRVWLVEAELTLVPWKIKLNSWKGDRQWKGEDSGKGQWKGDIPKSS